jgi:hypothetical protein
MQAYVNGSSSHIELVTFLLPSAGTPACEPFPPCLSESATMNAVHGIVAPSTSLSPDALTLTIGGRSLRFEFSVVKLVQATLPLDLDVWTVRVSANGGPSRPFTYKMGTGGRDRGPDPIDVLRVIASDVALALEIPLGADEGKAVDYLFRYGYAVWPSEALAMVHDLAAVCVNLSHVIDATGATPAEFVEAVNAIPYTPRCTLPMGPLASS